MLSKLAFKNVGRSLKDYGIYFLTLVFGVCVFYMFNSIEAQEGIMEVTQSQHEAMQALSEIINYISVFVSVVLGFLIVYANGFLIKRRKKELGIYMTLGMEKTKISLILVLETSVIAVAALAFGLVLGAFLSQLMSVFTAKLFEANMTSFKFIFSPSALFKSILYFGIIFLVVILFNTVSISKYKLIDLIYGGRKNQTVKIKNIKISVLIFFASAICIGTAYYLILDNGIININYIFLTTLVLGTIGTILFFMSLSGFLIKAIQQNKNIYLKNLNMFVLRQLNSKINTTFISMSVVCITLLLAIGTFSSGISLSNALSKEFTSSTPFDISIFIDVDTDNKNLLVLLDNETNISDYTSYVRQLNIYKGKNLYNSIINEKELGKFKRYADNTIDYLALSDYNELVLLQGKEPLKLGENEYAICSNMDYVKKALNNTIKSKKAITLNGKNLYPKDKILNTALFTSGQQVNLATVIVNDKEISQLNISNIYINADYKDAQSGKKFEDKLNSYMHDKIRNSVVSFFISREEARDLSVGSTAIVSFLVIYLSFIFIITCAAILSLQQLSESSDNKERYGLLKKLGADDKMINHSLFMQIFIYFMMPLSLAIVHSYIGLKAVHQEIVILGNLNIFNSIMLTAAFIIIIYGSYFIATYIGAKNIISKN